MLNTLLGGLIFLIVFNVNTKEEAFWANYTEKLDSFNNTIIEKSSLYDEYGNNSLLEDIKKELLLLEAFLFYTKKGGTIELQKQKIEVHQVLHRDIYEQIEVIHQLFKEHETQLNRSIASLKSNPKIKDLYLTQIHKFSRTLQIENKKLAQVVVGYQEQAAFQRQIFLIACLAILISLNGFLAFRLHEDVFNTLREITASMQRYFAKNTKAEEDEQLGDTIGNLKNTVSQFIKNIEYASAFAKEIGEGKLDASAGNLNTSNILGKSLLEMRNKLKEITDEDSKRNWISNGIAQVGDVLSGHQQVEFDEKVFQFTKMVTDYMACNQGAVFLVDSKKGKSGLKLFSAYAYEKKKFIEKELKLDEGLIGQCFQEKEALYLEEIPDDYIHITSGLGYANPRALLLLPILLEEECFGVIELASFEKLPEYYRKFGNMVSDKLATAISAYKMNEHTTQLLVDSRKMNEELTQKEEQMQNYTAQLSKEYTVLNEKLQAAKVTEKDVEKLAFMEEELAKMRAELAKYKDLLEVNKKELAQQDKKLEKKSDRIAFLQEKLDKLKSQGSQEQEIPTEKLAKLETENQKLKQRIERLEGERLLNQSTLSSINQSIPTAELNLKGEIIAANELFLKLFGYEQQEIINRHESILMSPVKGASAVNEKKWQALLGGQSYEAELRFIKKDKDTLLRKASYTPVKSPSGRLFKVILLVQGITV